MWCNISKAIFFHDGNFLVIDISFISTQNACFLYALCGNLTAFLSFAPKYTVQNHLWNKQLCPKFINVMIENTLSHKYGAKDTLLTVAMKGSLLSSRIFICVCPVCFAVTWCLSAISMYWFVSCNEPGIIPKALLSCVRLLQNLKSNWSTTNCHQIFH